MNACQREIFVSSRSGQFFEKVILNFWSFAAGLSNAIIYSSPDDKRKNRGFCFLEYESHKAASVAKKKLGSRPIRVWNCDIIVDWADPQEEPDSETMAKVRYFKFVGTTGAAGKRE